MFRARPTPSRAELLERLTPLLEAPTFWLPRASAAHVRHYMPGKDTRDLVYDTFVLPERGEPVVAMWPGTLADLDELRAGLELIPYLGRTQSWVTAELTEPREPNAVPLGLAKETGSRDHELVRLLAPDPGQPDDALDGLLLTTGQVRDRRLSQPPGSRWVEYARPAIIPDPLPRRRRPRVRSSSLPTVARYLVDSAARPPLTEAILVADLVRRAAMAWYGRRNAGAVSRVLAGKDEAGRPLEGHGHAFYLPTDEDGDRRIDHLTIIAPAGLEPADQEALASLRTLDPGRGRPTVRLVLVGIGSSEEFRSPLFESATIWRSHTPFIPVRHTKVRGSAEAKRIVDSPIDQLRLELRRRGYPEPSRIRFLRGARSLEFRLHRPRHDAPGAAYGFEIAFEGPVRGPLALGRSSHFGLGVFLPA
jgi:CRISPR-associated protein Csb2